MVDSAGGVSSTGSLAATENGPVGIASNSSGTFIYVTNQEGGISAYSVNRTTGELTPIAGAPFSTGTSPAWVGLPADGKYLYVVNVGSHDVSAYSVNSSTGALTALTPTATLSSTPGRAAIAPSGRFLYVAMGTAGTQILSIGNTGSLMAGKTVPAAPCSDITAVVLDSNTNFVFAADSHSGVCNYAVNTSNGDLTPISMTLNPGGNKPVSITIDPAAKFLFTANNVSNDVTGFNVAADGTLTPMTGSPFAAGQAPSDVVVDPSGKYVYVTNAWAGTISLFSITSDKTLKSGGSATSGSNPQAIAVTQ